MNKKLPKSTEVDVYEYITKELTLLGWNVKNPLRNDNGEVYKQNECLHNKDIKECLKLDRPEAIVILEENIFWIIEGKRDKNKIDTAISEAKIYAEKINKSKKIKSLIISGIAGNNDDGFIIENQFFRNESWESILFNDNKKNTLLSKKQAQYILKYSDNNYKDLPDLPDLPEEKYIAAAEEINEILHDAGINKNKRARFIAGIILSLASDFKMDINQSNACSLVETINTSIKEKLREAKKDNFLNFIKLELPSSDENHTKYKNAIKKTYNQLQTLDIKNAMNSGNDVLGTFYEKFLKYGNGAKEIGIVLTPRHVTNFAVKVLNIKNNDYVLDPTCGTGGFLVSALDYVKKTSNKNQIDNFKKNNLFGIEEDDEVIALALVNMIFRGDGRHKIKEGSCFYVSIDKDENNSGIVNPYKKDNKVQENKNPSITKVLMNPPFALKKGDEKESHFIEYALSQMIDGGLLFAIIPISVLVENSGKNWRKNLLDNNTLLASITLPDDLFYPVSVGTIGLFIKKGISHDYSKNVYFARAILDGFRKKKGKRLKNLKVKDIISEITDELQGFIHFNTDSTIVNIPEIKKICPLDINDKNLDLSPENYIDSKIPTINEIQQGVDELIRENIAFNIRFSHKFTK